MQLDVEEKGLNEVVSIIDSPRCRAGDELQLREISIVAQNHSQHSKNEIVLIIKQLALKFGIQPRSIQHETTRPRPPPVSCKKSVNKTFLNQIVLLKICNIIQIVDRVTAYMNGFTHKISSKLNDCT